MIGKRLSSLIAIFLLVRIWIWLIDQLFSSFSSKKSFSLRSFGLGALLVLFLYSYQYLLAFFWWNQRLLLPDVSLGSIVFFVSYILIFLALLIFSFKNRKKGSLRIQRGVGILSLMLFWSLGTYWWLWSVLLYYSIVAYAEELLKFSVSNNQSLSERHDSHSKLLFFALSIGLAFALMENVLSLITQWNDLGIILGRGVLSIALHLVATGSIALILIKIQNRKIPLFLKYFLAIAIGASIHGVFNLALVLHYAWLSVILILVAGVALTYLLVNTDELYEKKDSVLKAEK